MATITTASNRISWVTIEYDSRGGRALRSFRDPYAARRFYTAKDKEGKHPKIIAAAR